MPLSWIMGVPWDQCDDVATLIGLKTVVNEFVAYETLGKYKEQGRIFGRTEAIATFAICGFANPSSVGITMSMMNSLAPDKKESVANAVMRAFVGGSIICFITASIAGKIWEIIFQLRFSLLMNFHFQECWYPMTITNNEWSYCHGPWLTVQWSPQYLLITQLSENAISLPFCKILL